MFGHVTYLVFELLWGLPVLAVQWAAGWRRLYPRLKPLIVATICATLYLSTADGIAIHLGIWTIHRSRVLDVNPLGLPLEEAVFFLVTNAMVVQTVLLLWPDPWTRGRTLDSPSGET